MSTITRKTVGILGGIAAIATLGFTAACGTPTDDTTGTTTQGSKAPAKAAPAKPSKPAAPVTVKVKAATLIKEFEKNELKADAKYKGQTLKVTGVVDKVDTDLLDEDKYILDVDGGDEWNILSVHFHDIPTSELSKIDTGDKVVVVGQFKDGGDLGVDIEQAHI